jgi:hypothetical protein
MEIQVTNKETYKGQKERWTEEKTNSFYLKNDIMCVHKTHKKIIAFQSGVTTCVYDEFDSKGQLESMDYELAKTKKVIYDYTHINRPDNDAEWVYVMRLPKGTYVEEYDNEYRFKMNSNIKIELIGTMGTMKIADEILFPYETRCYGGKLINVWTEKF